MKLWTFFQDWFIATARDRVQRTKIFGVVFAFVAFLANIDYAKQLFQFFPVSWQPKILLVSSFCSAITFIYAHVIEPPTIPETKQPQPPAPPTP